MTSFLAAGPPNPSGLHAEARRARAALEEARRTVAAALLGRPPRRSAEASGLLFTGSGLEALGTALYGLLPPGRLPPGARVVSTAAERPEVLEILADLEAAGAARQEVALDRTGRLSLDAWAASLESPASIALIHHANHETGVLQPVEEAARLCARSGTPLLVDATWSFGRADTTSLAAAADLVAVSAHRAGGPAGVGALWIRPGMRLRPLLPGSGERGRRGGVEPVAAAVGLAALARLREEEAAAEDARLSGLRDALEDAVLSRVPGAVRNGEGPRLPGTSNLSFPGLEAEALALRLDLEGFSVSVGSACSSGSSRPGPTLAAMGLGEERRLSAVRLSLGWPAREEEVEALAGALPALVEELRSVHPAAARRSHGGAGAGLEAGAEEA